MDTSLREDEKWCTLVRKQIRDCGSFAPTLWLRGDIQTQRSSVELSF